jgi:WD40 repeat protein
MDSATGTSINHIDLGGCGGIVIGVSRISALAVTVGDNSACFLGSDVDYRLEVVDIESGRRDLILSSRLGALTVNNTGISAVMSEDGRYVAYGRLGSDQPDVVVIETETGEIVRTFETPETQRPKVFDLSLDGSLLAFGGFPVRVGDVTSGQVVAEVVRVSPGLPTAAFGLDGGHLYVTGPEMDLRIWDVEADEELLSVPAAGSGPISASSSGEVLVADPQSQSAVLVDQGLRGEVLTLPLPDCFIASGGLEAIEEALVSYQACPDHLLTTVTDPQTGEVMWSLEGAAGQSYGISPDGSRLVRQEGDFDGIIDSITVRGMATGASITQLDGLCAWDSKASSEPGYRQEGCVAFPEQPFPFWVWDVGWAPDGSVIVAVDTPTTHGGMAAWNATSGDLVGTHDFGPGRSGSDFVFSPDSREVIVSVLDRRGPTTLQRFDTRSWELIDSVEVESIGDESNMLGLVGWGADGRLIGVSGWRGQGASLVWFDAETLALTQRRDDIHEGSPRDGSIHESGRLIATASSDGGVRIWNAQTGDLLHEIRLGERSPVAVDFVDENHLLVGAADGTALVMTTDLDELVRLVSASLTRGFSPAECERFNFGDDCPTLGDMRSP